MKLIDKDALLKEIEKIQNEFSDSLDRHGNFDELENQGAYKALDALESFINTLDVKDIKLDEEIKSYFKGFGKFASVGIDDCIDIAKHFFELGMAVSNKAQKGE